MSNNPSEIWNAKFIVSSIGKIKKEKNCSLNMVRVRIVQSEV